MIFGHVKNLALNLPFLIRNQTRKCTFTYNKKKLKTGDILGVIYENFKFLLSLKIKSMGQGANHEPWEQKNRFCYKFELLYVGKIVN